MSDTFLTHAVRCSLVDYLDHWLLLQLRDGTTLIGSLMTFDQYSNIVLGQCVERIIDPTDKLYADTPIGTQIVRGENIVMLAKLRAKELKGFKVADASEVRERQRQARAAGGEDLKARNNFDEDWALQ